MRTQAPLADTVLPDHTLAAPLAVSDTYRTAPASGQYVDYLDDGGNVEQQDDLHLRFDPGYLSPAVALPAEANTLGQESV